jgi:hypothetical protein
MIAIQTRDGSQYLMNFDHFGTPDESRIPGTRQPDSSMRG